MDYLVIWSLNHSPFQIFPLHSQLKNHYRFNRALQAQVRALQEDNKVLNEELYATNSKISKRNFKILAKIVAFGQLAFKFMIMCHPSLHSRWGFQILWMLKGLSKSKSPTIESNFKQVGWFSCKIGHLHKSYSASQAWTKKNAIEIEHKFLFIISLEPCIHLAWNSDWRQIRVRWKSNFIWSQNTSKFLRNEPPSSTNCFWEIVL